MKNILTVDSTSTQVIAKVENLEELLSEHLKEEVVLYDECGDSQWDKVLAQYDLADQLAKDSKK